MAVKIAEATFRRLTTEERSAWDVVPAAVASDALNRGMTLPGAIQSLHRGRRLFGQARTVCPSPGDNACVLLLSGWMQPGEVMVVAGSGPDVAMAGEMVVRQCRKRGAGGIVVDGAMRDGDMLRQLDFPVYCRGLVPRGPVKEFGGFIDVPVGIGGIAISPGDLLIGDDDGITVVPLAQADATLRRSQENLELEESRIAAIERGELIADLFRVTVAQEHV